MTGLFAVIDHVEVTSLRSALAMRKIRNDCREYMTHDQSFIGIRRQIRWFYDRYMPERERGRWRAWIFRYDGKPVGFGLIRLIGDNWWLTGGLLYDWRGRGLGEWIFSHLIDMSGHNVYIDVLTTNHRALELYDRMGFRPVSSDGKVVVMTR